MPYHMPSSPAYLSEKYFLETFGNMTMHDFIIECTYSIDKDEYVSRVGIAPSLTVKSYYEKDLHLYKGHYKWLFFSGRDDLEKIFIIRDYDTVEVSTKPDGESSCWLEVGTVKEYQDQFGRAFEKWIRDQRRYPHKDFRLEVKRTFVSEYIDWYICVPLDYPLAIRLISKGPILQNMHINTSERTLWKPRV